MSDIILDGHDLVKNRRIYLSTLDKNCVNKGLPVLPIRDAPTGNLKPSDLTGQKFLQYSSYNNHFRWNFDTSEFHCQDDEVQTLSVIHFNTGASLGSSDWIYTQPYVGFANGNYSGQQTDQSASFEWDLSGIFQGQKDGVTVDADYQATNFQPTLASSIGDTGTFEITRPAWQIMSSQPVITFGLVGGVWQVEPNTLWKFDFTGFAIDPNHEEFYETYIIPPRSSGTFINDGGGSFWGPGATWEMTTIGSIVMTNTTGGAFVGTFEYIPGVNTAVVPQGSPPEYEPEICMINSPTNLFFKFNVRAVPIEMSKAGEYTIKGIKTINFKTDWFDYDLTVDPVATADIQGAGYLPANQYTTNSFQKQNPPGTPAKIVTKSGHGLPGENEKDCGMCLTLSDDATADPPNIIVINFGGQQEMEFDPPASRKVFWKPFSQDRNFTDMVKDIQDCIIDAGWSTTIAVTFQTTSKSVLTWGVTSGSLYIGLIGLSDKTILENLGVNPVGKSDGTTGELVQWLLKSASAPTGPDFQPVAPYNVTNLLITAQQHNTKSYANNTKSKVLDAYPSEPHTDYWTSDFDANQGNGPVRLSNIIGEVPVEYNWAGKLNSNNLSAETGGIEVLYTPPDPVVVSAPAPAPAPAPQKKGVVNIFDGVPWDHSASVSFDADPTITYFFRMDPATNLNKVYIHDETSNTTTVSDIGIPTMFPSVSTIYPIRMGGENLGGPNPDEHLICWIDTTIPNPNRITTVVTSPTVVVVQQFAQSDNLVYHEGQSIEQASTGNKWYAHFSYDRWLALRGSISHFLSTGSYGATGQPYAGLPYIGGGVGVETNYCSLLRVNGQENQMYLFTPTGDAIILDLLAQQISSTVPYGPIAPPVVIPPVPQPDIVVNYTAPDDFPYYSQSTTLVSQNNHGWNFNKPNLPGAEKLELYLYFKQPNQLTFNYDQLTDINIYSQNKLVTLGGAGVFVNIYTVPPGPGGWYNTRDTVMPDLASTVESHIVNHHLAVNDPRTEEILAISLGSNTADPSIDFTVDEVSFTINTGNGGIIQTVRVQLEPSVLPVTTGYNLTGHIAVNTQTNAPFALSGTEISPNVFWGMGMRQDTPTQQSSFNYKLDVYDELNATLVIYEDPVDNNSPLRQYNYTLDVAEPTNMNFHSSWDGNYFGTNTPGVVGTLSFQTVTLGTNWKHGSPVGSAAGVGAVTDISRNTINYTNKVHQGGQRVIGSNGLTSLELKIYDTQLRNVNFQNGDWNTCLQLSTYKKSNDKV